MYSIYIYTFPLNLVEDIESTNQNHHHHNVEIKDCEFRTHLGVTVLLKVKYVSNDMLMRLEMIWWILRNIQH